MTLPRSSLISLSETPYYQVISRCVRRAFLCGFDELSGKSFEHRRQWIVDEIIHLNQTFTIDIAAFAIMNNHYHLVVRIDKHRAYELSDKEVALRWQTRFKLPSLVKSWIEDKPTTKTQMILIKALITLWRKRLYDISWYMRCLNEAIARRANKEDKCKGHFWEARFKSQALLDVRALIQCMSYVDLNPIRAAITESLERSDYTSVQSRIEALTSQKQDESHVSLLPMSSHKAAMNKEAITFNFKDYLELIDWTSRAVIPNKRGLVSENAPKLLSRLNINPLQWINHTAISHNRFYKVIGTSQRIKQLVKKLRQRSLFGIKSCKDVFG